MTVWGVELNIFQRDTACHPLKCRVHQTTADDIGSGCNSSYDDRLASRRLHSSRPNWRGMSSFIRRPTDVHSAVWQPVVTQPQTRMCLRELTRCRAAY